MARDEAAERLREEQAEQAAFEQLSPEQRQIQALRKVFEEEVKKGTLGAGSQTPQKRLELLQAALEWEDAGLRRQAAALIRETLKKLAWSKKQKKQGIDEKLQRLEQ